MKKRILALLLCISMYFSLSACFTDYSGATPSPTVGSSSVVTSSSSTPPLTSAENTSVSPALSVDAVAPVPLTDDSSLEIHFIDVGQADSALILNDSHAMLIDGGNVADSDLVYTYLKNKGIDHLDYVVATHAHEDHVGGLAGALNYASADIALCPVTDYDSKAFRSFIKYLGDTPITIPTASDRYSFGSSYFDVLGPINSSDEPNNTSIVLKLTFGKTTFLFTGDAERDEEQDILNVGYDLSATVLKVGHHGSDTSTIYPFLREIMPQYAIISVGQGNSYGHPTEATLSRLRDADVITYRTDMQGTIICISDGESVSFSTERNAEVDTLDFTTADGKYGQSTKPSKSEEPSPSPTPANQVNEGNTYILNTNTYKFHYPSCSSVDQMKESNKREYTGTRDEVISMGYIPCKKCNP